jgi:hypothetical protein
MDLDCLDSGESADALDCDDSNAAIRPNATEVVGDGVDQDCDARESCYRDIDGDSYGSGTIVASSDLDCSDPGESVWATDCDDVNVAINPAALEVCTDEIDNNCDGLTDMEDLDRCGPVETTCSLLGDNGSTGTVDQDVYSFNAEAGEEVTVTLEAADGGSGRVTLILVDALGDLVAVQRIDRGALPNQVSFVLPVEGEYRIGVTEQSAGAFLPGNPFAGDYCLTVQSSFGGAQTLVPTASVEGSGSTLAGELYVDSSQPDQSHPDTRSRPPRAGQSPRPDGRRRR